VDAGVDTGPILAQAVVPVLPDDDADRLHERIKRVEHTLLPAVLNAISRGEIVLGPQPRVSATCFDPDASLSTLEG
jgi:phosphoribosylglycinamide formyltransferase-1